MYSIGIDIGTSSIKAVICDKEKNIYDAASVVNNSRIEGLEFESLQDPNIISQQVRQLLNQLLAQNSTISIDSIGISNQMHGIVYIDTQGNALSPLYTWQDKRAVELYQNEQRYINHMHSITSHTVQAGWGLATHYYNQCNGRVPPQICRILDIGSFVISQLSTTVPNAIHPSNAQSWGFYNNHTHSFDETALNLLGIDSNLLPTTEEQLSPIGDFKKINLYQSIGDNQAGVLGAISSKSEKAVVINLGTSGQISFISNSTISDKAMLRVFEERCFIHNKQLYAACSLSGGKSISIWVSFLASITKQFSKEALSTEEISNTIYRYLAELDSTETSVIVNPYFFASRNNPEEFASIHNLQESNFTLSSLSVAIIKGIVDELFCFWQQVPENIREEKTQLLLIGGATKIPLLATYIQEQFGNLPVEVINLGYETALGAALWCIAAYNT